MNLPDVARYSILVVILLTSSCSGPKSLSSHNSQEDSSHVLLLPELNLNITYPDDGMRGTYKIERSSVNGQFAAFNIFARYDKFILQSVYVTNFDSVDAFARRFSAGGTERNADTDAPESANEYREKKNAFDLRSAGDYYDDFAEFNGRLFANKRGYSYSGGYFYNFSFTYFKDVHIQVIITSLDDSLKARIDRQLSRELGDGFNYGDVWVNAVSDSLKEGYLGILSRIHVDTIK